MNKMKLNRLARNVKRLEEKVAFFKDLLPITISERENQVQEKLKYKNDINKEKLKTLAIAAGIKLDYVVKEMEAAIERVEEEYKLKLRALNQSKKRKLAKSSDKKLTQSVFAEKEKALLKEKTEKINSISSYYSNSKKTTEALKNYQDKKAQLDLEYSSFQQSLQERVVGYNKKTTKNINNRIKRIQYIISRQKENIAMVKSEIADLNYGLEKDTLLKLENLSMRFGGLIAVNDLSFEVRKGEIFGLIGPNGAGKTTIFNCITRFYKPSSGKMYFRENEFDVVKLNDYKVHNIVKLGVSRTFQNVELIWELSILDNLLVAAHTKYQTGFFGQLMHSRGLAREETVYRKKALDILALMDLLPYQQALPIGLPYGILKRIELARTLMINPKMIILDEPAAGLNEQETAVLSATIRKIRDEYNATIFLVEHDMGLVMDVCDTVCAISFGKKLALGTPKEIQENKSVREAYLGEEQ